MWLASWLKRQRPLQCESRHHFYLTQSNFGNFYKRFSTTIAAHAQQEVRFGHPEKIFIFFFWQRIISIRKLYITGPCGSFRIFLILEININLLANLETSKDILLFCFKFFISWFILAFKEIFLIGLPLIYEVIYHCGVLKTLLSLYPKHCTKRFAQAQTAAYSQVYLKFKLMLNCLILLNKS